MRTTSKNYPDWVEDLPDDNKAQPWGVYDQDPFVSIRQRDGDDPIQACCDWVLSVSQEERLERYAEDDIICEGPIVGYDTHHPGKEHVAELLGWVERMKSIGGTVKVEVA